MADDKTYNLDELAPPDVTIKLGGHDLKIPPPRTGQLLKMAQLSQGMKGLDASNETEVEAKLGELTKHLETMIPGLPGDTLNFAQVQKLIIIITDMSMPKDMQELAAKGITPDTTSKTP